ncbi:Fc receptor-like protein 5 [Cololabis saira]|uniref:Fc receptor-like protein 5 n=1 Tax=Cololabis saira TaxID=129043 RepID=UPI002AD44E08|nr:Fc receptor-like protein 5 [Cololabis saira]
MVLVSLLLGFAAFILHSAMLKELPAPVVSVWPPGLELYSGESVFLQCKMESNSTLTWTYQWYKNTSKTPPTTSHRHSVSGDSYSITAVKREDAGSYWCRAEQRESNVVTEARVVLNVSGRPPPLLTLTPSTRQFFAGERFTLQCPASQSASGWKLRHFSPGRPDRITVDQKRTCPPLDGAIRANTSDGCVFTAASGNSGLYWCEGAGGRSSAVNITVSYGNIILKTPAFAVAEGDKVVLSCHYKIGNQGKTIFLKGNEGEIFTSNSSSSDKAINWTTENVTPKDEGLYRCVSQDGKMESPASWLSVTPDRGTWKWIIVTCSIVLLCLIPLTVWLVKCHRCPTLCTSSWWPLVKDDVPAVPLPATKQDVTEVQWDLSWMEMSSLLDKQLYPGT